MSDALKAVLDLTREWDRKAAEIHAQLDRGQLNGAEVNIRRTDALRMERHARDVRNAIIEAEAAR